MFPPIMALDEERKRAAVIAANEAAGLLATGARVETLTEEQLAGYVLVRQAELAALFEEMKRRRLGVPN